MTQLIENKPPRHALIATLLHFSALPAPSLQHQEPNRNIPRLETHLTSAESMRNSLLIATKAHFASTRFSRAAALALLGVVGKFSLLALFDVCFGGGFAFLLG